MSKLIATNMEAVDQPERKSAKTDEYRVVSESPMGRGSISSGNTSNKSMSSLNTGSSTSNSSSPDNVSPESGLNRGGAEGVSNDNINYSKSPSEMADTASQSGGKPLTKKYFCRVCKQGFTRKHNMVSHELIHSSVKPHVCSVCDSKFRRIHDLKRHEKLHTGEKPFTCDRCSRKFARPDALTRHQNSSNACSGGLNTVSDNMVISSTPSESSQMHEIIREGSQENKRKFSYNTTTTTTTTTTTVISQDKDKEYRENETSDQSPPRPRRPLIDYQPADAGNYPPQFYYTQNQKPHYTLPHPNQHSQEYVSVARYENLVSYTHQLEDNISRMNSRLEYLESNTLAGNKSNEERFSSFEDSSSGGNGNAGGNKSSSNSSISNLQNISNPRENQIIRITKGGSNESSVSSVPSAQESSNSSSNERDAGSLPPTKRGSKGSKHKGSNGPN